MTHTPSGQQAVEQMLREEIRRMTGWNLSKNDCRNIVEKIHSAAPTAPSTAPSYGTSCDWKLMPRYPSQEMMDAGLYQSSADAEWGDVFSAYVDMWEAAPEPEDYSGDTTKGASRKSQARTVPSTAVEPTLVCGCGWEGSYADLNETAEGLTCPKCRLSRNMDCAATPPAQGVEEETETLENLIDAAIGARTTPPWQEQAAQIRRDALEEAAKICDEMYVTFSSSMSPDRKNNKSWAMAANALADKIRALVRSEKGEGK